MPRNSLNSEELAQISQYLSQQNNTPANTPTGYIQPKSGRSPLPVTNIPGAEIKPNTEYYKTADFLKSVQDLLPFYSESINAQFLPQAQAQLAASQATSGPMAKLMADLYAQYGPQLNATGNEIARTNALSQAETERQVAAGPGQALVTQALSNDQLANPEFYANRATTSDALSKLIAETSGNLGTGLSPTELEEVRKGLVREGLMRGDLHAPSATSTISNAMQYGAAGRARETENQNQLSKAIAASNAFLPASRSNLDTFQIALGRTAQPNTGETKFTGVQKPDTATSAALGSQLYGSNQDMLTNRQNINAQKKDWLDQFVQFTSGLSNIGSAVGGAVGVCWIAREVYGENNPRWKQFRTWLLTKAPESFRNLYVSYGERFAEYIKDKQELKNEIRVWMDKQLAI